MKEAPALQTWTSPGNTVTQRGLAEKLGVSANTVARWERDGESDQLIRYGGPARIRTWDQLIMSQRQGRTESTSEDPSDTEDEDLDEE